MTAASGTRYSTVLYNTLDYSTILYNTLDYLCFRRLIQEINGCHLSNVDHLVCLWYIIDRERMLTQRSCQNIQGRLRGIAVACWTTDHYHPCSNPGVGISVGCFVFHFVSLPLEVARPIQPTLCTKVAVRHQSSSSVNISNIYIYIYIYSIF